MAGEGSLFNVGSVCITASLPAPAFVQQWLTMARCWLSLILASLPTYAFVQQWLTRAHWLTALVPWPLEQQLLEPSSGWRRHL
jgi:hypothetical protein